MTGIRFEHPEWIPNNCTACGKCYTVCPDTAIPGLVSELSEGAGNRSKTRKEKPRKVEYLPKAVRQMEGKIPRCSTEKRSYRQSPHPGCHRPVHQRK